MAVAFAKTEVIVLLADKEERETKFASFSKRARPGWRFRVSCLYSASHASSSVSVGFSDQVLL